MTSFALQFLGSGNARSKPPVNFNTNVLVHAPRGKWLIDCGVTAPLAIRTIGENTANIEGAFITHMHGDHVFGLEEILFESYFKLRRKFALNLPRPFWDDNNPRGEHFWRNYLQASMTSSVLQPDGSYIQLAMEDYANVRPVDPDVPYDFWGVPVRIFPVEHVWNRSSFGICLDDRIYYTSDTTFSRARIEQFVEKGAEIIFHDASFLPYRPGTVHTAFEELCTLPRSLAEKVVLMHYDDEVTEIEKQKAESLGFRLAERARIYQF